ncbi:phenylalanine 4-monooxygenase [bacterium]|nr:phenylalanine 4-monooxygenase [bacterium]
MSTNLGIPSGKLSTEVEFKARPSDPIRRSPSPEGTIGEQIIPPDYAHEQHSTWAELYKRQSAILSGRVCAEYLDGRELLNFPSNRVPQLADLSRILKNATGWQVIRVEGYVPEPIFFRLLANKCFPCTDFIRHPTELEYTPAPDMFHDLMGHLPLITNSRFAGFFHAYGLAGLRVRNEEEVAMLGRIYWFTVEFGLMNPNAQKRDLRDVRETTIYGAGIVSSVGEIMHSLSDVVKKEPFNAEVLSQRPFDIHHMQDTLFEITSFDELESEFRRWASSKGLLD